MRMTGTAQTDFRSRRGLALPLVLWSIAFLAGLVVLVAGIVGDWISAETRAEKIFRARQMALSGIAIGLSQQVKPGDPLLTSGSRETEGYEVKLSDESGKLNPNFWIIQNNREIFTQLFESWNVDDELCDRAIDGLIDWVDADDFRSLHGAERGEYEAAGRPGFPANRPLLSVREMEAVLGLDEVLASQEDWRSLFTVWYNGKINIQYASQPLLIALAGLTPEQCRALFELRAGPDAIEGSEDDVKFESIEEAAGLIGARGRSLERLEEFFDVSGSVRRIESTGFCNGIQHKIIVISPENGGGQIMNWEEE
jgi:general secretion pathway protein K